MKVNRTIFREYDIRGIYGKDLTDLLSYHVGRAYGTVLNEKYVKSIILGCDNRQSSPAIIENLTRGLTESGINVVNTGYSLTPEIAYFTCTQGFDAAISVTASHNPKEYNGIKFYLKNATPYFGASLAHLADRIEKEDYINGAGRKVTVDYGDQYISEFYKRFKFHKKFKVVVSGRNGISGVFLSKIMKSFGLDVVEFQCDLDSSFPNGTPNPEDPKYMADISSTVKENKADLGVALDTDGDRVGICDEQGVFYETDQIFMLLSKQFLIENAGAVIAYDVKCTENLKEVIQNAGGTPKMLKTGRTVFAQELKAGALLGAEYAGHIYFGKDFYGIDDAIFTACKVIDAIDRNSVTLHGLMKDFPKSFHTQEMKVMCPDELKFEAIEKLKLIFEKDSEFIDFVVIDGIKAYLNSKSSLLVRASNTSPYLSTKIEADTLQLAEKLKNKLAEAVETLNLNRSDVAKASILHS